MSNLLAHFLAMSVAGSVVVCFMLLLRPVTTQAFSAKWQYRMGKTAIFFFLMPVAFITGKFFVLLSQPLLRSQYPSLPIFQETSTSNGVVYVPSILAGKQWSFGTVLDGTVLEASLFVWLTGVIVFTGWYVYCYRRFSRELHVNSFPLPVDSEINALLHKCKMKQGIRSEVRLLQNRNIASPKLVGLIRPTILLPDSNMQGIDLELVLTHELMHLRRKDLWVKMFALAAGILHWYNPLAHVLRKDIHIWGELSCDEALASEMTLAERKRYGETILNSLDICPKYEATFYSSLSESGKLMKRRLAMLINVKKTKKHVAFLSVAVILAIGGTGAVASALVADYASKENETWQVEKITAGPTSTTNTAEPIKLSPSDTSVSFGSDKGYKMIEITGDGKKYTFDEFKQWLEDARLEANELVKSGVWTQEQANKMLATYEQAIMEIEKNGGMAFGQLIDKGDHLFPEKIENFYNPDELVFELPAKLADTVNGEVAFTLGISPNR